MRSSVVCKGMGVPRSSGLDRWTANEYEYGLMTPANENKIGEAEVSSRDDVMATGMTRRVVSPWVARSAEPRTCSSDVSYRYERERGLVEDVLPFSRVGGRRQQALWPWGCRLLARSGFFTKNRSHALACRCAREGGLDLYTCTCFSFPMCPEIMTMR